MTSTYFAALTVNYQTVIICYHARGRIKHASECCDCGNASGSGSRICYELKNKDISHHVTYVYYWLDDSVYINYHVLNTINVMWGLISKNEKKKGKI